MDIAAGSGSFNRENPQGVAPKAELAFVNIATLQPKTVDELLETTFGDSVRVIEAVKYIFDQAKDKPCVINLSLGTNGGPHDGTNPVEEAFDALLQEKPNRAIVIAASNSYADKIHKTGFVKQGEVTEIKWNIPRFDRTYNEVEIWYSGKDEYEFDIIDDQGKQVTDRLRLNESGLFYGEVRGTMKEIGYVVHKKHDEDNGDNVIHIFQDPRLDVLGGTWSLRVHGKQVTGDGKFHAWIERDDNGPTEFQNDDSLYTLGSISTSHKSIVVGSYDAHRASTPLSYFSSSGPTRDERKKPEVSAPGHAVIAANSTTKNGVIRMSGTSMAAPAVTGLIARIFRMAVKKEKKLSIDDTRKILIDGARKDKNEGKDWHPRYGFGKVSAQSLTYV